MWLWLLVISAPEDDTRMRLIRFQYEQKIEQMQSRVEELENQLGQCQMQSRNVQAPDKTTSIRRVPPPKEQYRADRELYETALSQLYQEDYREALVLFEKLTKDFPVSEYADNSIFWMAKIYLHKDEKGLASIELRRLLEDYPTSERLSEAKAELDTIESSHSQKTE